jgi:hypothetical protein
MNIATITINLRANVLLALVFMATAKRKHSCCHRIIIYILQSHYHKKVRYFSQIHYHPTFKDFNPRLASSRPLHVVSNCSKL